MTREEITKEIVVTMLQHGYPKLTPGSATAKVNEEARQEVAKLIEAVYAAVGQGMEYIAK